jgi:hypothetical protein
MLEMTAVQNQAGDVINNLAALLDAAVIERIVGYVYVLNCFDF